MVSKTQYHLAAGLLGEISSRVLAIELPRTPRAALPRLTPPGSKDSKGNWALAGVRGVFQFLAG